ncbi:diguanylate cyclase [Thalassotalea insulae]|uniref:Diguanylate cyclase n=1 Tax=Thalassotalea insulae TaxID=2056778 RepID=A0ABQ6GZ15_9GAMM|nr:HDOD domain-containing protein [Thalassotalea insulae]GLX80484.1 diguanylate cyclase [Thalassotalea insulae]
MQVYTARQAILNRREHVVAYELLYRDSPDNIFPNIDPHEATSKVVMQTHLNQGLSPITDAKPALINFGEQSLIDGLPLLLPRKQVMVEILETVTPNEQVYQACKALYHQGYHLALDDFIYRPEWSRFFKFIKLIKFDIQLTPLDKVAPLVEKLKQQKKLKILAEKVETQEEFEEAKRLGFHYFQGYYFCKPQMNASYDLETNQPVLLSLVHESLKSPMNINKISNYFEHDSALSYKLLKFVNSGILPITQQMDSIKKAVVYLGDLQIKKLILLMATGIIASNKPKELTRIAIIRARFCELIAQKALPGQSEACFITGLFSLLDAMLDKPMAEILENLSLAEEVTLALLSPKPSILKYVLDTVREYEKGSWYKTKTAADMINVDYELLAGFYKDAVIWANKYDHC